MDISFTRKFFKKIGRTEAFLEMAIFCMHQLEEDHNNMKHKDFVEVVKPIREKLEWIYEAAAIATKKTEEEAHLFDMINELKNKSDENLN